MNLVLLLPAALGALLALAIPLLIHLSRRQQYRPTVFAALRWLRASPKPRRRVRFDEWPLLLVRLLLLALIALWLARPVLHGAPDTTPWTVVAPGVPDGQVRQLAGNGEGELRWLAAGFPPLSQPAPASPQPVASLLRQLDAELPGGAALRVVVPERLSGLDGGPLQLSREVEWHVVPAGDVAPRQVEAAPRALVVRHAEGQEEAVRVLRAAVLALREPGGGEPAFEAAAVDEPLPGGMRRLAWIAPGPLPDAARRWIEDGGEALLGPGTGLELADAEWRAVWRDDDGTALVEEAALGRGRVLRLHRPLRPADMPQLLEPSFPHRLQALFEPPPMPTRAFAQDVAPVRIDVAWPAAPRALQPWLAVLVALLALLERWLATSPRRGGRA